jgi:photosystem II stability/assembly factor-like uncharacterized protein
LYVAGGITALVVTVAVAAVILFRQTQTPVGGAFTGGDPAFVGPDLHSIVVDPQNPSRIFVGGHASATVSTDGGRTLQQISGLKDVDAMSWLTSPDGRTQFVAGHSGVRLSTDGGNIWTDLTAVLPGTDVHAAGIDPASPSHLWAYVVGLGVYSSTDTGRSWNAVGGQDLSPMGPIVIAAGGRQLVAADMKAGIVRSKDGGHTWSVVAPGVQVFWLTDDPGDANHLLAVGQQLFESADGGASWKPGATLPDGVRAVAIAPGPTSTWFAGKWSNQDASVMMSTDHGLHWQAVAPGP